jgi:hypothetical protein
MIELIELKKPISLAEVERVDFVFRGTTCVQEASRHLRSRVKSFHAFFEMSFWKPAQEIHWTGNSIGDGWTDLAAAFWCWRLRAPS